MSKYDQMKVIVQMLGDQNPDDLSFITEPSAKQYIHRMQGEHKLEKIRFGLEYVQTDT